MTTTPLHRTLPKFLFASCFTAATILTSTHAVAQVPTAPNAPKVGDPAPELGLVALYAAPDGQETTWADLKGKTVVIEFWATWCAPCVAAFPHINEIAHAVSDRDDIVMIAVTDEGWDIVEPFLETKQLDTWIGIDTDRTAFEAYGVKGIPRTVIVGPDGNIAADLYPTMLSVEMLDSISQNKPIKEIGGPGGMPPMPKSLAEFEQLQAEYTKPGKVGKVLAKLEGEWYGTKTAFPMGPMGDGLTDSVTHSISINGDGRFAIEQIKKPDGRPGELRVFGYDTEKSEYYLHMFSPGEPAPLVWTGQWDESSKSLTLKRAFEAQMGSPGGGGETIELTITYEVHFKSESEIEISQTLTPPAMGGMPPPPQLMSQTELHRKGEL